ncbi:MAG: efflux RND transporter permease subunit, partial [Desulfobacteraceae bacterium]
PLIFAPGAGSEFYRGLGSVFAGGLLVSTVFTIFLIPALLSLTFDVGEFFKRVRGVKGSKVQEKES